jgi:hypothetical protein
MRKMMENIENYDIFVAESFFYKFLILHKQTQYTTWMLDAE